MYQCTRCKEPAAAPPQGRMILARHGETDLNRKGIGVGSIDVPLNDEGKRQARVIGFNLNGRQISTIQSSPMVRGKETALIIADKIQFDPGKIIWDERLRERCGGILEGKPVPGGNIQEAFNYSRTPAEAEVLEHFENRIAEFLKAYHERFSGANSLIVTHSHVILAILKFAYGWVNKDLLGYQLPGHDQLWPFAVGKVCWNCGGYFYEETAA